MKFSVRSVLGVGLGVLSACSSGASEEDYDDIAAGVGALLASGGGEAGSMADAVVAVDGEVPVGLTRMDDGSVMGTRGGMTYAYSLSCLDEAGAPLARCGEATDSARLTLSWSGAVDWPRYDATVERTGDWTLTGLRSDTARLDGEGHFDVSTEFMALYRNETRTYDLDYDAAYDGVLVRTADRAIVGGAIRYSVRAERTRTTARRDVQGDFDMDVHVTFAGDGTASLTLDGERQYRVDVASGAVSGG